MESSKLGKKIRDWATGLGFRLPDGSLPPADCFALLTATPHRRHLWEVIVESVLPRQKIEYIRKQILVAKLQDRVKITKKNYSQQIIDKVELWHKQNDLENELKEKRNTIVRLEENTLEKASDVVFDICKMAELKKQLEELNDKLLILKLFSKREKKLVEDLQSSLLKVNGSFKSKDRLKNSEENIGIVLNQLISNEILKCPPIHFGDCYLFDKIKYICESGTSEQHLWEEVIKYKKSFLQQFLEFLIQLNSSEKDIFREKVAGIEKNLNHLVAQLKQRMTSKSLQVVMNSVKGKILESEIEKMEKTLFNKEPYDGNFNESISFLSFKMNDSFGDYEKTYKKLRNHLAIMGLKTYREFLKEELKQLEDKEPIVKNEEEQVRIIDEFDLITNEINSYKLEEKQIGDEIFSHHYKYESLLNSLNEETIRMKETKTVEETVEKLKSSSEKQIKVFLEIPLDAFRTVESSSGRIMFECESESHCLENYGGELKQFFSTMLIPPLADSGRIISEIKNRKRILNEIKKFTTDRESIAVVEKKIENRVNSINCNLQLCEKNYKESDGILWSTFSKTEQLNKEIDFVEKILKSWVEQPYRLMIADQVVQGKSLKEFEERYRKREVK